MEICADALGSVEGRGGKQGLVQKLQRTTAAKTGFSQELVALITVVDVSAAGVVVYRWAKTSSTTLGSYETTRDVLIALE